MNVLFGLKKEDKIRRGYLLDQANL